MKTGLSPKSGQQTIKNQLRITALYNGTSRVTFTLDMSDFPTPFLCRTFSEGFREGVLTGQMRETRRPVVAISLSGSNRSLSWTRDKVPTK